VRLIFEIWEFGLALAVTPFWTKWYLPLNIQLTKYITSGELTISLLWVIHFSIRFPFKSINIDLAKDYVRHAKRG
jgi:hypothetical protein